MSKHRAGLSSTETEPESHETIRGRGPVPFAATIVFHPDLGRIGERAYLGLFEPGEIHCISRNGPFFAAPRRGTPAPLGHRRLSRRGVELRVTATGLEIDASGSSNSVISNGHPIDSVVELPSEEVERGIALLLARRIVLWLHRHDPTTDLTDGLGLVGESAGLVRVRNEIPAVARASFPVLVRGETGTGKELIAQAIARHPTNPRRHGPFVVRNMATIGSEMAVAELFGAREGAYSGQKGRRRGAFQEAHGGTLFLDEIGDTAAEVQPMLLRALESGEVEPLAGEKPIRVDVRILAATDLDLESAIASQQFRSPLRHRLASFELQVPPLRERKDDLGRLMVHFLRTVFAETGESRRLEDRFADFPWLPAPWVADLLLYPWPGNVRQFQNVIRRWVLGLVESHWRPDFARLIGRVENLARISEAGLATPEEVEERRATAAEPSPGPPIGSGPGAEAESRPAPRQDSSARRRQPAEIGRDELLAALDDTRWTIKWAAERLGIGRTSIYELLRRHGLRTNHSLTADEIRAALAEHEHDLEAAARTLGVSRPGLVARMTTLGMR